jgi:OmpA-OmpF porin, OOP family
MKFQSTARTGLARLTLSAMALAAMTTAHAQTSTPQDPNAVPSSAATPPARTPSATPTWGNTLDGGSDYSLLPYTKRGYVGLNLGKSEYSDEQCGAGAFACDDADLAGTLYTGGMFNEWLGMELGYVNMGKSDRAGGRTEAQGLNVSLVGRIPIQQFSVFAKGGTTYGRTKVTADALSLVPSGKESGWGASYGAGVGLDVSPATSVVLEWARHDFHYAGIGKQDATLTSLGLKYRF